MLVMLLVLLGSCTLFFASLLLLFGSFPPTNG